MKEIAIASVLYGTLILPAYGGGIYVGDVRFLAKEICSREYTSTFHWNSGCLPITCISNAQNYFFEDFRLPVSHDEARKVDEAAQGFLNDQISELVEVAEAAHALEMNASSVIAALKQYDSASIRKPIDDILKEKDKYQDQQSLLEKVTEQIGKTVGAANETGAAVPELKDKTGKKLKLEDARDAADNLAVLRAGLFHL